MNEVEKLKRDIDYKINKARNEYIDWNYSILNKDTIEKMSQKAYNRILIKNKKIWVTV